VDEAKLDQIDIDTRCVQSQLEGLFRQLHQGSTQMQLAAGYRIYKAFMDMAVELFGQLSNAMQDYEQVVKEAKAEDESLN